LSLFAIYFLNSRGLKSYANHLFNKMGKFLSYGTLSAFFSNRTVSKPMILWKQRLNLDYRGFIYITDRAGKGMFVLEFTGGK